MRFIAITTSALLTAIGIAPQSTQPASSLARPPLALEVAVRQYRAQNQIAASAGDSGTGRFERYVWADRSLCEVASSGTEPSATPGVGWHFTAEVVNSGSESAADQLQINVEWQRLWENGARLKSGANGSRQITLREGERVELDRVTPVGESRCGAVDARLEAAVVARSTYRLTALGRAGAAGVRGGRGAALAGTTGTVTGGARGGVSGGVGRGVTAGVQSGTATTTASGVGRGVGAGVGGRGSSTTTIGGARGGALANESPLKAAQRVLVMGRAYDAELWLVHRTPDGSETVQQQALQFGRGVAAFTFPPVQVSTSRGAITLDIAGSLQAFVGDAPNPNQLSPAGRTFYFLNSASATGSDTSATPRIMLSISRRARASGTPLLDITGGSSIAIDMPSATDVLSFEFPALQKATEDLLKGHQFSLRLRVKAR